MSDKCRCIKPRLVGKLIEFVRQKGGDEVNYRDFRIDCLECRKFWGYMTKQTFKAMEIPTYETDDTFYGE